MDLIAVIMTIIESGLLVPIVLFFVKIINGMKCQLRHDMLQIYYRNIETKVIRQYEYENFVLLYESYKALKGNSFIDRVYREVQTWKIVT